MNVGGEYRYKEHLGTITTIEKFLDKNNQWHIALVVHLPTLPEGEQWLATHGLESDFIYEKDN